MKKKRGKQLGNTIISGLDGKYGKVLVEILKDTKNHKSVNGFDNWVEISTLRREFFKQVDYIDASRQREYERLRNKTSKSIRVSEKVESLQDKIQLGQQRLLQRALVHNRKVVKSEDNWYVRLNEVSVPRSPRFNLLKEVTAYLKEKEQVKLEDLIVYFKPIIPEQRRFSKKTVDEKIMAVINKLRSKDSIKIIENDVVIFIEEVSFSQNIKNKREKNSE